MGIKNLLPLLRSICPHVFRETHISEFEFQKVGVDISLYLYKYKSVSADYYISSLISLFLSLKQFRVHPIIVFDGKAPIEKTEERKKRSGARDKLELKSFALSTAIKSYRESGIVSDVLTDSMQKINSKKGDGLLRTRIDITSDDINIKLIEEMQKKIDSQIVNITTEDILIVKKICEILKIQWVQAPGEAEAFCSYMCINGKLAGVLSEDSDIITYSAPCFISKYNIKTGICVVVKYEDVIDGLGISKEQFLDLCIMCGTDYNINIPRIGSKTAYKMILLNGCIEDIKQISEKLEILNYKRGREIFNTFDNRIREMLDVSLYWNGCINEINSTLFNEFITFHNCQGLYTLLEQSYRCTIIEEVEYTF
jgi:flap endonuclease-1